MKTGYYCLATPQGSMGPFTTSLQVDYLVKAVPHMFTEVTELCQLRLFKGSTLERMIDFMMKHLLAGPHHLHHHMHKPHWVAFTCTSDRVHTHSAFNTPSLPLTNCRPFIITNTTHGTARALLPDNVSPGGQSTFIYEWEKRRNHIENTSKPDEETWQH